MQGFSFHDAETIRIRQIAHLARAWLKNEPVKFDFHSESISSGRLHEWSGRIFVTVDGVLPGTIDELREMRSKTHEGLRVVFEQWQREKKSFKEVFAEEKASYGQLLVRMYADACRKREQMAVMMMRGQMPPLNDVLPSRTETLVSSLQSAINGARWQRCMRSRLPSVSEAIPNHESVHGSSCQRCAAEGDRISVAVRGRGEGSFAASHDQDGLVRARSATQRNVFAAATASVLGKHLHEIVPLSLLGMS
jgi:hypothetical protein